MPQTAVLSVLKKLTKAGISLPIRTVRKTLSPLDSYWQATSTVVESILPGGTGRIRLYGIYWYARTIKPLASTICSGTDVKVIGRDGLALLVHPLPIT